MMLVKVFFLVIMVISMNGATLAMDSGDGERFGDGRRADYARGSAKRSLNARFAEDTESDSSDNSGQLRKRPRRISIFDAIDDGDSEIACQLIHQGIDLEQKNYFDQTPLIFAAHEGYADIVEELLESKASLAARDENNYTALMYAVENNDVDVIRVLVDYCNRERQKFESQMLFAASLVPQEINGQENPYFDEIYSMFVDESSVSSKEKQKQSVITQILTVQKQVKKLISVLGDVVFKEKYQFLLKQKLERKKLNRLCRRYKKLIDLRDKLALQYNDLMKKKEKETLKTEERELDVLSCFVCCEKLGDMNQAGRVILRNLPCSGCAGRYAYVCTICFPQLEGVCSFCKQKFEVKVVAA